MTKLFPIACLITLLSGCSPLEYELTDLEPSLFAADAPEVFAITSTEKASEGIFIYDLRVNFSSPYESLSLEQKGNITGIIFDDRIISDPAQQFFVVREVQSGTRECVDVSFEVSNGQNARITELCFDVD
jgi:hypothetical protein